MGTGITGGLFIIFSRTCFGRSDPIAQENDSAQKPQNS